MLTVYVKSGCPYCARVYSAMERLGLSFEEKNIASDEVSAELIAKGGKRQVPYLVDSDRDEAMYESADIVDYLDTYYGVQTKDMENAGAQALHSGNDI